MRWEVRGLGKECVVRIAHHGSRDGDTRRFYQPSPDEKWVMLESESEHDSEHGAPLASLKTRDKGISVTKQTLFTGLNAK